MGTEIPELWQDIEGWLKVNAPVTAGDLNPPQPDAHRVVSEHLHRELPEALTDYLGCVPSTDEPLFGLDGPLPATAMASESAGRLGIYTYDDMPDAMGPAGTPDTRYSSDYLTLTSNGGGDALILDLRDGPRHGCVTPWDKVEGTLTAAVTLEGAGWDSLTDLLVDLRNALFMTAPFRTYFVPVITDGQLDWDFAVPRTRTHRMFEMWRENALDPTAAELIRLAGIDGLAHLDSREAVQILVELGSRQGEAEPILRAAGGALAEQALHGQVLDEDIRVLVEPAREAFSR
jgi:hypothetical protein